MAAATGTLEVGFSVTGATPDELAANADEVVRGFADGRTYDLEVGPVHGALELDSSGKEPARPSTFSAHVRARVHGVTGFAPPEDLDDEVAPLER